jgi:phospholipid/cholesterol/gamma-HCH transport system permease protein
MDGPERGLAAFSPTWAGDQAILHVATLDVEGRASLLAALEELAGKAKRVDLDLAAVEDAGTLVAATLLEALEAGARLGFEVTFESASKEVTDVLRLFRVDRLVKLGEVTPEYVSPLEALGGHVLDGWAYAKDLVYIFEVALYWGVLAPLRGRGLKRESVIEEMLKSGATAWPIVATIGALMGTVLAINAGYQLRWFGAYLWVADLVGVAITRELGPIMTAILVAGRSGSTIAAEIGTMKVTEEVDALRTMGLNPGKFLIAPKVLGLTLTLPGLVLVCDLVAIVGGFLVGVFAFGVTGQDYFDRTCQILHVDDVLVGMVKAVVFGILIGVIACHEGFRVHGGADDVGRATTAAVVRGILLVLVANAFFTWLFYVVKT